MTNQSLVIVMASANPNKAAEMEQLLEGVATVLPRPADVPDVVEDADTLEGNARLKASAITAATQKPAISDDTGLEVDALGGAPGVYSARYAGEEAIAENNMAKLLEALRETPTGERTARFRTVAVLQYPDGSAVVTEGVVEGVIATEPRGNAGFGYDPLFIPTEADGRTFAEMTAQEKHRISHRGRAFAALKERLAES